MAVELFVIETIGEVHDSLREERRNCLPVSVLWPARERVMSIHGLTFATTRKTSCCLLLKRLKRRLVQRCICLDIHSSQA